MSKMDENNIKKNFKKQMNEALSLLHNASGNLKDGEKSHLSSLILVFVASIWETYMNDIFIAYISKDKSTLLQGIKKRYISQISNSDKIGVIVDVYFKRKYMKKEDIVSLVSNKSKNIGLSNSHRIELKAKQYICPKYSKRIINMSDSEKGVINLVTALRNHIIHGSDTSKEELKKALEAEFLDNTGFKRANTVNRDKIGSYLNRLVVPGRPVTRIERIIEMLKNMGENF